MWTEAKQFLDTAALATWFYAGVVEVIRDDPGENTI